MTSTASTLELNQTHLITHTIHRRIQSLQDEVCYLNKIIQIKDHALQQLDKLFKQELALSKGNIAIYQNMSTVISSFTDINFDLSKTSAKVDVLRNELNELSFDYLNYHEAEENKLMKWHNQCLRILRNIDWSEYKMDKDFALPLEKNTRNNIKQAYIYQIPVEIMTKNEHKEVGTQFDLFETPSNTQDNELLNEVYSSQMARHITSQIVQMPVQINHTHQIQVHMVKVQEVPIEIVEIREIPIDLVTVHEIPVVIKREYDIPIELDLVEEERLLESSVTKMKNMESFTVKSGDYDVSVDRKVDKQIDLLQNSGDIFGENIELRNQVLIISEDNAKLQIQNEQLQQRIVQLQTTQKMLADIQFTLDNKRQKVQEQLRTNDELQSVIESKRKPDNDKVVSLETLSPKIKSQPIQTNNQLYSERQIIRQVIIEREVPVIKEIILTKYIQVPIIKQQSVIEYVPVIKQVPVEVIVQVDKIVQKQVEKIIQNIFQKVIEKKVFVKMPVLKQVPVEVIKYIEKKIFVKIPVIKEIPIELVSQMPTSYTNLQELPIQLMPQQIKQQARPASKIIHQQIRQQLSINNLQAAQVINNQQQIEHDLHRQLQNRQAVHQSIKIYQVPVEVIQQRVVDRFIQLQRITQVTTTEYIQVKQFIEIQVQKKQYVPIVVEIPVQLKNNDSQIIDESNQEIQHVPAIYNQEEREEMARMQREMDEIYKQQVIFEVPVECFIEKYIQIEKQVVSVCQIPVFCQVQTVKEIEKIVQVQKIVQVIKQIEKIVQVEKIIYVPISQKVQKIVYVNTQKIVQVPVEVIVQVIKEVPVIVQVPVQLSVRQLPWPAVLQVPVEMSLKNAELTPQTIIKQVQKVVQVEKIVQVEVEKMGQVIVIDHIVQVQKIVYVDRVVQKIVQVVKYVPYLVEVPVELTNQIIQIVQIPVEMQSVPELYQLPVELIPPITLYEIPVNIQNHVDIAQFPVQLNTNQPQIQQSNNNQPKIQLKAVPMNVGSGQIQIELPYDLQYYNIEEIRIQMPEEIQRECVSREIQTEEDRFMLEMDMMSNIDKLQNHNKIESTSSRGMQSMLKVWQIPVELQLDYNIEQLQRTIQLKYRDKYTQLNNKYLTQISQLHLTIDSMQKIVFELNQQKWSLQQFIQDGALKEERLKEQLGLYENEHEVQEQVISRLNEEKHRMSQIINCQSREIQQLEMRLQRLIRQPVLRELPVEIYIGLNKQDQNIQTEQIDLFANVQIIEVLVDAPLTQHLSEQSLSDSNEQASNSNQQANPSQSIKLTDVKVQTIQSGAQTEPIQLDNIQKINTIQPWSITQSQPEQARLYNTKVDIYKIYQQLQGSHRFKIDQTPSYYNHNMISGIEVATEYQHVIDNNVLLYEIPVQIMAEPIIYEVPVMVNFNCQQAEVQTQTDYLAMDYQPQVVELPVELIFDPADSQYSYRSLNPNQEQLSIYRKLLECSQKIAMTDSNSNIIPKDQFIGENNRQRAVRQKQYSEYYSSRMIQIPIELQMSRVHRNLQKFAINHIFGLTIENMHQEEAINLGEKDVHFEYEHKEKVAYLEISNIENMHYQTSFHGYNPNITYINDSFDKIRTTSEIAVLVNKNYKQSPPITNQNNTQAPQQVRHSQHPTLHADMSSKKHSRLEYQSIQNITITREMIIKQQSEINSSVEYNRMLSPHLQITDMNYSEYPVQHDQHQMAVVEMEQQRNKYKQMYDQSVNQIQQYKAEIAELVRDGKDKEEEHVEQQSRRDIELFSLRKEKQFIEKEVEQLMNQLREQAVTCTKLQEKIGQLTQGCVMLKDDSDKIEQRLNSQIEKLRRIVHEKDEQIDEAKKNEKATRRAYDAEITELEEIITKKADYIKELEHQLQTKDDKLEHLTQSHDQLRKNLASLRRNQEIDPAEIYEQEFERVKEIFEEQKHLLRAEIQNLTHEYGMLKEENRQQKEQIAYMNKQIQELQEHIREARDEFSTLHHVKSQIEMNYITGVKELQQVRDILKEKEDLLQKYQNPQTNEFLVYGDNNSPAKKLTDSGEIRIEYLTRQNSRISTISQNSNYTQNLQNVILKYQRMLIEDQKQIEEYQQKVCEYLRDALQKEQEAQSLFSKLVEYEGMINTILIEKVTIQAENKRLIRTIEMSQRKAEALSNKLLQAVRTRYDSEQQSSRFYYQ